MTGPLTGVRVVELGVVIAGPAASAILADWGADVVKLEPPEGDPQRGNIEPAFFRQDNRGKRSMAMDLKTERGREVVLQLLETADVFVTNLRPSALERLGLDWPALSERFPRLVYAAITGYGDGPEVDRPGYDIGAFFARVGTTMALTPRGGEPPFSRPGMGDHTTGANLAAGVCAALVSRAQTGKGQRVSTSLLRSGVYFNASDLSVLASGGRTGAFGRRHIGNPLLGAYRSADDHWFCLLGVQAGRHWPGVTRAIGRPELAEDPRFAGAQLLFRNFREVIAILDEAFAERPLAEWEEIFAREDVWYELVQTPQEAVADPGLAAAGAFRDSEDGHRMVATPVDFSTVEPGLLPRVPETGEHTEEVLLELGWDWERIIGLKDEGVIP